MTEDDPHALRSEVCHRAADWLAEVGHHLWVLGHWAKHEETHAVGVLTQMIGQLGQEAADAFDRRRWYAANSLVRQIVECQYFMAVFRDDPTQRVRWLEASTNRIDKSFRPGQMREASGFRVSEYKQHCSWGGHPNPSASWLLPNHQDRRTEWLGALFADLALHLTETIDILVAVIGSLSFDPTPGLPSQEPLQETYERWRAEDPFSRRVTLPDSASNL